MNRFMYSILLLVVVLMSSCESSGSGSDAPPSPYNSPPGPGEVQFKVKIIVLGEERIYTINTIKDLTQHKPQAAERYYLDLCTVEIRSAMQSKGALALYIYNPYPRELGYQFYSSSRNINYYTSRAPANQYTAVEYFEFEEAVNNYFYDKEYSVTFVLQNQDFWEDLFVVNIYLDCE